LFLAALEKCKQACHDLELNLSGINNRINLGKFGY
jgi:hypothetical protein